MNIALQVGAFLSKLTCYSFFIFPTKGFNLAIQAPTAEMHTDGILLTSLLLLTSDHAVNVVIPDYTAAAMIYASKEPILIMDFLPVLL